MNELDLSIWRKATPIEMNLANYECVTVFLPVLVHPIPGSAEKIRIVAPHSGSIRSSSLPHPIKNSIKSNVTRPYCQ